MLPDGARLATTANPSSGYDIAHKQYVDNQLAAHVKKYDSGWFAVAVNTNYAKAHGLGVVPTTVQVFYSNTSNGSGAVAIASHDGTYYYDSGAHMYDLDATNIKIRAVGRLVRYVDGNGDTQSPTEGYYKIVALAVA